MPLFDPADVQRDAELVAAAEERGQEAAVSSGLELQHFYPLGWARCFIGLNTLGICLCLAMDRRCASCCKGWRHRL